MSAHSSSRQGRLAAISVSLLVGSGALVGLTGPATAGPEELPGLVVTADRAAPASAVVDASLPADDEAKGLVRKGLRRGQPGGPCAGLLETATASGAVSCTHGPDAAPKGVDVRHQRTVSEFAEATKKSSAEAGTTGATVPCYGDGTSGPRVQAIYAHASDKPDRYFELR